MKNILAKLMPTKSTSEEELEEMRRMAWQSQGVIAVRPHEIRDDWLRQALINFAEARYGRRETRGRTRETGTSNSTAVFASSGRKKDGNSRGGAGQ